MPVYVGRKYSATKGVSGEDLFTCGGCGHVEWCSVTGVGEGAGNSAFFLDDDGAAVRAEISAVAAAEDDARTALSLARCPRCMRRRLGAVARFWAKQLAHAGVWLAGGIGLAAFFNEQDPALSTIMGIMGVVAAFIVVVMAGIKWSSIDGKVLFPSLSFRG